MADDLQDLSNKLPTLLDSVIDRVMMLRLANRGIAIVRERTLKGEFLDGSSDGAGQYSTKPFARPLGGLTKALQKTLVNSGSHIFTASSGNHWIVIEGGYRAFRAMAGKDVSRVTMTWTGRMLRNLGVISEAEREVVLGFPDADMKQLATWHNVMGAGKSLRKHVFMGVTQEEANQLVELAGEEIAKRLTLQNLG